MAAPSALNKRTAIRRPEDAASGQGWGSVNARLAAAETKNAAPVMPRNVGPDPAGNGLAYSSWHYVASPAASSTGTLGNGVMRLLPWRVERTTNVRGIAVEVTAAGQAASKVRLAIYDHGGVTIGLPGRLVVDAGTALADAVGFASVACSVTLQPGLYWLCCTVQDAATTQPTLRTIGNYQPPVPIVAGTALPTTGQSAVGYSCSPSGSTTGPLVQQIPDFAGGLLTSGNAPRFLVQTGVKPPTPATPLVWEPRVEIGDFYPASIGTDGSCYGYTYTYAKAIQRTSDGGLTVETGWDFIGQVAGEVPIWSTRTTDGYVVVMSSDNTATGAHGSIWFSATFAGPFTKVQTILSTSDFSISKPAALNGHTVLLVGEYGLELPSPARGLWLSTDGGQTWTKIRTTTVTNSGVNAHCHGSAFDPTVGTQGRIWASFGDGANSLWTYSDNLGSTWTDVQTTATSPLADAASNYQQPVVVALVGGATFGSVDRGTFTAGLWRNDPTTGQPTVAFTLPSQEVSSGQFGRAPYAQSGTVTYIAFPDSGSGRKKTYIVGTPDSGATWLLVSTIDWGTGNGARGIVGPDNGGRLFHRMTGGSTVDTSSLIVCQAPIWA